MTRVALLLVDVQNDFFSGGALPVPGAERVLPVLNAALRRFEAAGCPVYASRDWHPLDTTHFKTAGGPWPVHCVAGSAGAAFHPGLRVPAGMVVVSSGQGRNDDGYSAFEGTTAEGRPLADDLRERQVRRLYVGGVATDYCVRASVLDACAAGLDVRVITDGIAGIQPDDAARALDEMRRAGASLVTSAEIDVEEPCTP